MRPLPLSMAWQQQHRFAIHRVARAQWQAGRAERRRGWNPENEGGYV
jgi:hypothetical protein